MGFSVCTSLRGRGDLKTLFISLLGSRTGLSKWCLGLLCLYLLQRNSNSKDVMSVCRRESCYPNLLSGTTPNKDVGVVHPQSLAATWHMAAYYPSKHRHISVQNFKKIIVFQRMECLFNRTPLYPFGKLLLLSLLDTATLPISASHIENIF